ncbi:hypothetical protein GCM10009839_49240 [Catenulispora yoronensis]|uniref:Uncharacterized protein n=1 Tax=Catenulispora yoronensis TaxID=450799 RepID=A0ABP5G852_9ACTN
MVVRAVVTIVPSSAIMNADAEVRIRTQRWAADIGGFGAAAVLMSMETGPAAGTGRPGRDHFPGAGGSVLLEARPCHP